MSVSSFLSTLRAAGRQQLTASTAVVARKPVTGSHLFRIDRYKQVRKMYPKGTAFSSSAFDVGGHDWRVVLYPNGDFEEQEPAGFISLYLRNASHARTGDATAKWAFSILDSAGRPCFTQVSAKERRFAGYHWGWREFVRIQDLNHEKNKFLVGGCLNVLCEVTVAQARIVEHMEGEDAAAATAEEEAAADDEEEADVKIVVGRETFAAHRRVLEARSPAFARDLACSTPGGGGDDDDDCEVVWLRVDDMDPQVFKALLHFIYTDKLPPGTNQLHVLDTAATAKQLLIAADTHKLEKLKLICEKALCKHIANSSVGAFLALAEARGLPVLSDACLEFLSSPGRLKAVVGSVNFQQLLKTGCPSALMKLIVEQLPAAACLGTEVPEAEDTTQMNA